jgi:hypothetical protein
MVSDLLGPSTRRYAECACRRRNRSCGFSCLGRSALARLSAQLRDYAGCVPELNPIYRRLVKMALEELHLIEQQTGQLDYQIPSLFRQHQRCCQATAKVPASGGLGAMFLLCYKRGSQRPSEQLHIFVQGPVCCMLSVGSVNWHRFKDFLAPEIKTSWFGFSRLHHAFPLDG